MKVAVFYTLFLGIFLAGRLAAQAPRLVLPVGHTNFITTTSFSPDSKNVLTASWDKTAKIWDAQTGKLLAELKGHTDWVLDAQYSPDAKMIVTASLDGNARIWNAVTGELMKVFGTPGYGMYSSRFSGDSKRLITASADKTAGVWNKEGKKILTLEGHNDEVLLALFSPDGKKIVTCSRDKTAALWDAATGKKLFEFGGYNDEVTFAELDSTGKKILITGKNNEAKVWDAETGKWIADLKGHTDEITAAHFSPDGKKIMTASKDKTVKFWNAETGAMLLNLNDFTTGIDDAVFSPDGKKIVIAAGQKNTRVWDAASVMPVYSLPATGSYVAITGFSNDGKKIITVTGGDYKAYVWNTADGRAVTSLQRHSSFLSGLSVNKDEKKIIITAPDEKTVWVWNVTTGNINGTLKGHTDVINLTSLSKSGKKLVTTSYDETVRIWDVENCKLIRQIKDGPGLITFAALSPDEKNLISITENGWKMWNTTTGKLLYELKGNGSLINMADFSSDSKRLVTVSTDGAVKLFDVNTGEQLASMDEHLDNARTGRFSTDGNRIVTTSDDNTAILWNGHTGEKIKTLDAHTAIVNTAAFSTDGKWVVTSSMDSSAKVWNATTGDLLADFNSHKEPITNAVISTDEKNLISLLWEKSGVEVWDIASGKTINRFSEHNGPVTAVSFIKNGQWAATISFDNMVRIWDLATAKPVYSFFPVDSADYFTVTASGYYQTTPEAAKLLHYVTNDLKVISFEQLDVKYNRPDKVLEAIGNTDTALIKSYRKAWEKRIKKLGIDTTQFKDGYSVPECDFANREQIEAEQKTETLRLHIKATDSTYRLDRFNVWVNESPLFGQRGISIKRKNSNTLDTIINIKLSQGENRIECSITNVNGTESYRMPLYVNFTPAIKQKESLRFIGIGLDRFSEKGHELQYSVKDIRDLSAKLKEKYGSDIQIDTLFNENVNSKNVKALKKQLQQSSVNDKVILAYSGHGLLSKDYDYYLSTYTVDFNQPEKNGLPYDELENLLDSIPARRKLMLIDACHSGEVDKEEMTRITAAKDTLSQQGTKGGKPTFTGKTTLGMKNSFELMQSLFVNVGKSTGATVISAAAGTQFALERGDLKNGVFTYSILEAMNKYPSIKISELRKIVGERVEKLTNGLQKPTSRNETISSDWEL